MEAFVDRQRLEEVRRRPEQGMGFGEEHIRQATPRLQCPLVQKAMQDKAIECCQKNQKRMK